MGGAGAIAWDWLRLDSGKVEKLPERWTSLKRSSKRCEESDPEIHPRILLCEELDDHVVVSGTELVNLYFLFLKENNEKAYVCSVRLVIKSLNLAGLRTQARLEVLEKCFWVSTLDPDDSHSLRSDLAELEASSLLAPLSCWRKCLLSSGYLALSNV